MRTICVSGGMDPVTSGHIDLIEDAANYGPVVVILNSDDWLVRKKGYCFMPYQQRRRILLAMKDVSQVVSVDDADGSVCEALRRINPGFFANGGDRTDKNTLELDVCEELGIEPLFGIGGGKTASSSDLVQAAVRHFYHE